MTARTQVAATWRCPPCKKKILSPPASTSTNSEDNITTDCQTKPHDPSLGNDSFESITNVDTSPSINVGQEIRLFRREMQTMRYALENRVGVLEDGMSKVGRSDGTQSYEKLETTISELQDKLQSRDQELLMDDIEIAGIPEQSSSDSVLTTGSVTERVSSQTSEQTLPTHVASTLHRNRSSLHSGSQVSLGGSMTSLTSAPPTPAPASSHSTSDLSERPRVSHGKPNLAPKPPTLNPAPDRPSPPPKKLVVNGKLAARAQSMRVPRSPPVSPPSPPSGVNPSRPPQPPPAPLHPPPIPVGTKNPASHFGTLRAPRGLRPPGVCPPPPPGAPPPPPARGASLAPPPPPHHRQHSVQSTHSTSTNEDPSAPPPPVRGSSHRAEWEARFAELFRAPRTFPAPPPFLRVAKGYCSAAHHGKCA
ncbi:unnamed protein product [Colias eurytheme]|nr:unnamed protein product [Colias eurytheme]